MTNKIAALISSILFSLAGMVALVIVSGCTPDTSGPAPSAVPSTTGTAEQRYLTDLRAYDVRIVPDSAEAVRLGLETCVDLRARKHNANQVNATAKTVVDRFRLADIAPSGGEQYRMADQIMVILTNSGLCK